MTPMSKHPPLHPHALSVDGWHEDERRVIVRAIEDAYSAGRAQGLREAREVCEQRDEEGEGPDCWDWHAKDYAAAIQQLEGK